jgi:formate/nitrite transporter FocA (FNT family)
MYFIPLGLLLKDFGPGEITAQFAGSAYAHLTWVAFARSLVPVTIGNVIGGGAMVGGVYWFIYLRRR